MAEQCMISYKKQRDEEVVLRKVIISRKYNSSQWKKYNREHVRHRDLQTTSAQYARKTAEIIVIIMERRGKEGGKKGERRGKEGGKKGERRGKEGGKKGERRGKEGGKKGERRGKEGGKKGERRGKEGGKKGEGGGKKGERRGKDCRTG